MLYAVICNDKKDHLHIRLEIRPKHLEYLKSLGKTLKFAGPFLDADEKPDGTLVVVEAKSPEEAKSLAENDPYAKAGLFSDMKIRPWRWSVNNPEEA
ncbi:MULTISPECIES: YciI-like protein [Bartonella]|uniref:YCII-related domain-containing protein n=1 Tax=Bartonella choladocola TaxID=2750995 RepID=A0A1U9ML48_9HYPH|nr:MULTISPECIES: YciI-like protein [Bartonella]AQT48460.1 hypothetical protein BBC0122_023930 [Bartonella choladocola]MBH9974923.1 hypothetical protein [Bartonella choladocola]MBI0014529.1 hypothetical protein [Bartonella sp. B10834G3]MBI0139444.1 hypothetical protein [Bartonella choladocola]